MLLGKRVCLFFLLFSFAFFAACGSGNGVLNASMASVSSKQVSIQMKDHRIMEQEITLSAIGDILIHRPVYKDAKVENGYDFTPMLGDMKDYLTNATVTVANQETMIGGAALGLSSYPSFNSPYEVGDALKEVGVDVVTLANNHTLDRGEAAIQSAIEHWETIDMMYTGAYKDELDRDILRIFETDEGISVAFLSYTYGTNGIPVPEGKDYLVNLIDKKIIAGEIAHAKEQADMIVLSLHFGNEYERLPNDAQKELVQFAADQGVHAVLGHHPHVLQPMEWVTGKGGNNTFVIYSLGNFLSNQQDLYQRIGGILTFSIKKTVSGTDEIIEIHSPKFMPTFVTFQSDWTDYKVIPMYKLTNNVLNEAEAHYEEIKSHMSQWLPELEFVEG
ncbi:CapA family protein [Oceanobacillus saliphilus]|uniref:CapA family protein n=1 Tax=Oceanobacillus saliphilus TaxID=2925834 RepID=UPI00201D592C|nr:CapA family protein [Oceanobacillus saliphilus]